MPTSASPRRNVKAPPPPPRRFKYLWPLLLLALAVLTVVIVALPASLAQRFLPPALQAEDFSGSLWHGSAGKFSVNSHDAGALEWRIHPGALLTLGLSADVHWVKGGFVTDAGVDVDRQGIAARNVVGGGPIEDLGEFGIPAGWHGTAALKFTELKAGFGDPATGSLVLESAVGELDVAGLNSPQIAAGTDLGGYVLRLANGAITPDADATAELSDTGGPLEVRATIHFSVRDHTGQLSGTVKERAQAPAALRDQMENLTQLHARDAQGRIPVELEFTL